MTEMRNAEHHPLGPRPRLQTEAPRRRKAAGRSEAAMQGDALRGPELPHPLVSEATAPAHSHAGRAAPRSIWEPGCPRAAAGRQELGGGPHSEKAPLGKAARCALCPGGEPVRARGPARRKLSPRERAGLREPGGASGGEEARPAGPDLRAVRGDGRHSARHREARTRVCGEARGARQRHDRD